MFTLKVPITWLFSSSIKWRFSTIYLGRSSNWLHFNIIINNWVSLLNAIKISYILLLPYCFSLFFSAFSNISLPAFNISNPPLFSDFLTNGFYSPIIGTVASLCNGAATSFGTVFIGDSLFCLQTGFIPYCNGPLPAGSYR